MINATCALVLSLVAGALYLFETAPGQALQPSTRSTPNEQSPHDADAIYMREGPWGRVRVRPFMIAPPIDMPMPTPAAARWVFEDVTRHEFADFCAQLALSDHQFTALLHAVVPAPSVDGFVIKPDASFVQSLSPTARAQIYNRLSDGEHNIDHINAYRCWSPSVERWLRGTRLSDQTRALIKSLTYHNGRMLFFADLALVLEQIDDPDERDRLRWALARERTVRLQLHIAPDEPIESLVAYWGAGGRDQSVRPLLASMAQRPNGGVIDVVHLLPTFARQRLYTYPLQEDDLPPGDSRDCHWSALNFFNARPDDRLANITQVSSELRRKYTPVQTPRFGDVVVFESAGEIFHSATYIAANIVMTKNGTRLCRPWMLLPLQAMKDFYPKGKPISVRFLRLRDEHRVSHMGSRLEQTTVSGNRSRQT